MSYWDRMVELVGGPARFRFIVQPLLAILFGLRDAKQDAALGKEPYLLALLVHPERAGRLKEGFKTFSRLFVVAVLLDALAEYLTMGYVLLWAAVVTGVLLVALPYSLARGLGNRVSRTLRRRHA